MDSTQIIHISKKLSYLLRHGAVKEKLTIDSSGYVLVDSILKKMSKDITLDTIKHVVENDSKSRFDLQETEEGYKIRANQGHSKTVGEKLDDEETLAPITLELLDSLDLPDVFHGTYQKFKEEIMTSGLKPMTRKHIHFTSSKFKGDKWSGIRKDVNWLLHIDIKKAIENGKKFYISQNNVILTPDVIEPEYFVL